MLGRTSLSIPAESPRDRQILRAVEIQPRNTGPAVEIWTQRTLKVAHAARSLKLARGLRERLRAEGGEEPIVVLLAHAWYGAEEEMVEMTELRGLFVQYPGQEVRPALSGQCKRWESVSSGQVRGLGEVVGRLAG